MHAPIMHYGDMEFEPTMQQLADAINGTESAELVDTWDDEEPEGMRNLWYLSDGDRRISVSLNEHHAWTTKLRELSV